MAVTQSRSNGHLRIPQRYCKLARNGVGMIVAHCSIFPFKYDISREVPRKRTEEWETLSLDAEEEIEVEGLDMLSGVLYSSAELILLFGAIMSSHSSCDFSDFSCKETINVMYNRSPRKEDLLSRPSVF